ncbi:MAG: protein ImuB [Pseudomonadales bacterium]|jgi:protein ImuB
MLWLCLNFSKLPLEIFTRHQANNQSQASLVVENNRVLMCNQQAHQQGVDSGMSVNTAYALAEQPQTIARDRDKEVDALTQLAHWAYRYTPSVSVGSPNDLLLEISSVLKLYQGLDNIVNDISNQLSNMGYSCQIGLAHTPKAAWLMARAQPGQHAQYFDTSSNTLDKSMLKMQLEKIPLNLINCPQKQKDQLQKLGLHYIGELMDLPVNAIGRRFGKHFLRYIAELRGDISDPRLFIQPQKHFQRSAWFSDGITNSQALLFPMRRLLEEFSQFLHSHQLDCSQLTWKLKYVEGDKDITVNFSQPSHLAKTFFELSRETIENTKLEGAIESISLHCEDFSQLERQSETLFVNETKTDITKITSLIDKLASRLGKEPLEQLVVQHEHLPEQASMATRLPLNIAEHKRELARQQLDLNFNAPKPLWLLPAPVSINQTNKGLFWNGKLTLKQGPERIEDHWKSTAVKRDYFVAEHENGSVY